MFSQPFLDEIKQLALQIAWNQRQETEMQSVEVLRGKFQAEQNELVQASEPWDELPDITYYAACLKLREPRLTYPLSQLGHVAWFHSVSQAELEAATLAKYRIRASGAAKDILAERAAILAAVASVA